MCKNYIIKLTILGIIMTTCSSCQSNQNNTPRIVPAVEVKREVKKPEVKQTLGIIGEIEPVYILPMKSAFHARIDTGAQTSSIDVFEQKVFERDGKKWVSFSIINRETGEKQGFEKRINEIKKIKRIDDSEERIFVIMDMKVGNQIIKEKFSLANRDKFNFQVLIGRNVLTGRAIVDTSLRNTLK